MVIAEQRDGSNDLVLQVEYRYDAFGNRISRTVFDDGLNVVEAERYLVDGWDPAKPTPRGNEQFDVWADLVPDGTGGWELAVRRVHGSGFDEVLARQDDAGDTAWYGTDRQGSVRTVFDNSGDTLADIDYDAFGGILSGVPVDRYAYTGREWDDALGLQYSRARMYDPSIGRWISEDPIGFDALDPNLQRYVGNGPTNGVDPSGMAPPLVVLFALNIGRQLIIQGAKQAGKKLVQREVARQGTKKAAQEIVTHTGSVRVGLSLAAGHALESIDGPGRLTTSNPSFFGRECLNARPSTNYDFQLSLQPKTDPLASPEAVLEAIKIEQQEAARNKKKDKPCFPAGTPIRTPDGYQNIEDLRAGDLVLSRDESDQDGPVLAQRIEEVFTRYGLVWSLHVGGQVIQTTAEHPFYVKDRGWVRCDGLQVGDLLMTELGHWLPVEDLLDTGEWMALYNFRVAEFHTYFVGTEEWGFSVWTHNACIAVRQWENGMATKHFSVEITDDGGTVQHSHQSGAVGTNAQIELWTNRSGMTEIGKYSETISDAQAKAAMAYVTTRIAAGVSGPYNIVYRSCTVYIWDVMKAAGVPALPARPVDGDDTSRANQRAALTVYSYFATRAKGP